MKEPERLTGLANEIRALAEEVGSRWSSVDAQLELGPKRGIALFDVDFSNWIGPPPADAEVSLTRTGDRARLALLADKQLTLSYIEGPYDVLNVVRYLLERQDEPRHDVRTLELPENVETISAMIDQAEDPDSAPVRRFKELQVECNRVIAEGFGLTVEEQEYITHRLAAPPLDVLQPRWPWTPVEIRDIQEYDSDRFA